MHTLAEATDATPALSAQERIQRLEAEILGQPQVDLKTRNVVTGRMIARTITVPAGTVLTGATHKRDHINIVQGDITVSTDDGMKRLTGQHTLATKAGHKRVGYAHADTEWTTICQTDLTDIADIEDDLVVESEKLQSRHPVITQAAAPEMVEA